MSKDNSYMEQAPALDERRGIKAVRSEPASSAKASGGGVLAKMKRFVSKKAPPKEASGRQSVLVRPQAVPQSALQGDGQDSSVSVSALDQEASLSTTRRSNLITTQHQEEF